MSNHPKTFLIESLAWCGGWCSRFWWCDLYWTCNWNWLKLRYLCHLNYLCWLVLLFTFVGSDIIVFVCWKWHYWLHYLLESPLSRLFRSLK